MKKWLLLAVMIISFFTTVRGQNILIRHRDKDTAYIKEYYKKHLVVRLYESTKFYDFKYLDDGNKLIFKPNNHNNVGFGFNYRFISLNFGFFLPFAEKNNDKYGNTTPLDLQTHVYVDKFIIDFYGQFYKGYYLSNTGDVISNPAENYLIRPDISTQDISLEVQYLFNDKEFSYNAPFYQNERQKRSAGSFILGGGIFHTQAKADSAFLPSNSSYNDFFHNLNFNQSNNVGFDFIAGYAYTLVFAKRFFVTDALSGGMGINRTTLTDTYDGMQVSKVGPQFNLNEKFAIGYNSDNYFAGLTYIRLITEDKSIYGRTWQQVNAGNTRVTVAKRFKLKKALIPKNELIEIE